MPGPIVKDLFPTLFRIFSSFSRLPSSSRFSDTPNEERNLTEFKAVSAGPTKQAAINPAEAREHWPPFPETPSTRPSPRVSALFTAHLLRCEGSKDHYYEDAAAFNIYSGFAAVADGLTVGSRSDLFADALVRHFVQGEFYLDHAVEQEKDGKRKKLSEREKWWENCSREWEVQTIRLYSEMNAEEQQQHTLGSGAAFIGFWIDPKRGACLYSVGDCYALWFSGNKLQGQLPETSHFNNNPATIDARLPLAAEKLVSIRFNSPQELPGERLILCSDALAEYFLTHTPWEKEAEFWQRMEAMNDASFGRWADAKKAVGELKDDDYTFLMLQFPQTLLDKRVVKSAESESSVAVKVDRRESEVDTGVQDQVSEYEAEHKASIDRGTTEIAHARVNSVDISI